MKEKMEKNLMRSNLGGNIDGNLGGYLNNNQGDI